MDLNDLVANSDDIEQIDSNLMLSAINASKLTWTDEKPHRRLLESEDSNYDSDYENNDLDASDIKQLNVYHDEVSRTISDTLAAEFEEYVTTRPLPQQTLLAGIVNDPLYTSRVEFALKLGYTEAQVQIALMRLGTNVAQNELLAELIKLGSSGPLNSYNVGKTTVHFSNDFNEELYSFAESGDCSADTSSSNLRPIVIDGSNVAISHGNKECFSCMGIKICVDWFKARGHTEITVFVPMWRKEVPRPDAPIKDQEILLQLESEKVLSWTPSRNVGGRRIVCYDDRYILKLASETDGIVVSNDNYRDLISENPEFKKVVEERLLMYSFVNDRFMPPDDPLGRHGPSLSNFLRKKPKQPEILPPSCPYGKKCTYGNKCKYYHPERGNQPQKSVTERLAEQAKIPIQEVKSRGRNPSPGHSKLKVTYSLPLEGCDISCKKLPLLRTKSSMPSISLPLEEERNYQSISYDTNFYGHLLAEPMQCHSQTETNCENLHKKLHRQLTLIPNDPRLHHLQQQQQQQQQQQHLLFPRTQYGRGYVFRK